MTRLIDMAETFERRKRADMPIRAYLTPPVARVYSAPHEGRTGCSPQRGMWW